MEEDLLTEEEIKHIIEEAKKPEYSQPNLLHLGTKKTSIFRFSAKTGLILVNGNHWTGREHIDLRHSQASRMPYWEKEGKIGNPSKFPLELVPISYLFIADQIYNSSNLNLEKNKRPDVFDTYIGYARFTNLPETEYTLLVYKGTKIIHTFYVSENKKPFNKKKVLDLRQGWASGSIDFMSGKEFFKISYFDNKNIELYKIILVINKIKFTETWYVQINSEIGSPILTTLIRIDKNISKLELPFRMIRLDISNLTWIEKEIKKMVDGKFEF